MTYAELKKEYVIETIAKGDTVILCDFAKLRMNDCIDMTVNAINNAIAKAETKFFKVIASE